MSWLLDVIWAPPPPPPLPSESFWSWKLCGSTVAVCICSGLGVAWLRRHYMPALRSFLRTIFPPEELPDDAKEAKALLRSMSSIEDHERGPLRLQRAEGTLQLESPPGLLQLKSSLSSLNVVAADADASPATPATPATPARPVLEELRRTERDYVEDLRSLATAKAALIGDGLLPAARAHAVFGCAEVLLTLNEEFLSQLNKQAEGSSAAAYELVAAAFASLAPYFRVYAEYCSNYFRALQTLQEIRAARGGGGGPRRPSSRVHRRGWRPERPPRATLSEGPGRKGRR
jgi:hypothetical protein